MGNQTSCSQQSAQQRAEIKINEQGRKGGPFVAAVEATRMPMVVTDPTIDGNPIIYANDAFLSLCGYGREDILGQNYYFLAGPETSPEVARKIDAALAASQPIDIEVQLRTKDDRAIWVAQFVSPVKDADGRVIQHFASFLDITRRKELEDELRQANEELERRVAARTTKLEAINAKLQLEVERRHALEAVLRASLDEQQELVGQKNFLIKEVHHRVKNSFQMAMSLLTAQSHRNEDDAVRNALQAASGRLARLADLHELLYRTEDMQAIDVARYLDKLSRDLVTSLTTEPERVGLHIDADEVSWGPDRVLPLALIVNEAVTNALKYAFPDGRRGTITVQLRPVEPDSYRLCVGDDGVGMSQNRRIGSLGLKLIELFAKQIGGTVTVQGGNGTTVSVVFSA